MLSKPVNLTSGICTLYVSEIVAVGMINEAIDKASPVVTLQTLLKPSARLKNIEQTNASHYQNLLGRCKKEKAKASCKI